LPFQSAIERQEHVPRGLTEEMFAEEPITPAPVLNKLASQPAWVTNSSLRVRAHQADWPEPWLGRAGCR